MIDFKNAQYLKLKQVNNNEFAGLISPILTQNEVIVSTYKSIRDGVVFTNKRIIAINVQGITGSKKRLHISSIQQNISLFCRNCRNI